MASLSTPRPFKPVSVDGHVDRRAPIDPARRTATVVFVDIDDVDQIKEAVGHDIADDIIDIVGARLCHALRDEDTVTTRAPGSFTVIVRGSGPTANPIDVGRLRARFLEMVDEPIQAAGRSVWVTLRSNAAFNGAVIRPGYLPEDSRIPQ